MSTVAIIQARMGSTRFPGKVLETLGDSAILGWVVRAAEHTPSIDEVVVATTTDPSDDPIEAWCKENGISSYRGSVDDVLDRFAGAARQTEATSIVRLTSDCPLLDPDVCEQLLLLHTLSDADYSTNCDPATWPDGLDCEVMTAAALFEASEKASRPSDREHVTPYIRNRRRQFNVQLMVCPLPGLGGQRWTIDHSEDLEFVRAVVSHLPDSTTGPPRYTDVLKVLCQEPQLTAINTGIIRNEGLETSVTAESDTLVSDFTLSQALLDKAQKVIPLGSQTFSKSHIQYPKSAAPMFITHGRGARVWDVDGNEYIDLVSALLPVILGYNDQDVDSAVRAQLNDGITFSLAAELETVLAERLIEIVPCAEMVRFGKNGTDATSATIRIARAATGRDHIAFSGYHGWQDWYVGATTRNKGVPSAVSDLSHVFPFGNMDALYELFRKHPGSIAAVIMEPANVAEPKPGYLDEVKEFVHKQNALLIFDEVITGFRLALGGAQEHFGVTPDLAAFGKAMGNGLPISAVLGRAEFMKEMEEIFFSSTFGGETLSLAASIAVIEKMQREPVIETLWQSGSAIAAGAEKKIHEAGLDDIITLNGMAPWKILAFGDHEKARKEAIKTLFVREMIKNGILLSASHNVSYAHTPAAIATVINAYGRALAVVADELATGKLEERLEGPAIEPVFTIRPLPALNPASRHRE